MTSGHSKGFCLLAVLILSWASACSKGTEEPQQEPQQQIPVSDSNPKSSLGNLTFAAPSEWIEESPPRPCAGLSIAYLEQQETPRTLN